MKSQCHLLPPVVKQQRLKQQGRPRVAGDVIVTHCEPPGSGAAWWFTSLSRPQAQGEGASAEVLTTFAPAPSPLGGNNCGRRFTVVGTGITISFATGRPPFKTPRRTFIGPQDALNKCAAPLPTAAERRAKSGSRDPIDFARRSAAVGGFKGPRRGRIAAFSNYCILLHMTILVLK